MRGRWFIGFSLLAGVLTLATGAWLWQSVEVASLANVEERVSGWLPVATVIRLVFIALLAYLWPALVSWVKRRGGFDEAGSDALLAQRWRIITWLLVIELVFGVGNVAAGQGDLRGGSSPAVSFTLDTLVPGNPHATVDWKPV